MDAVRPATPRIWHAVTIIACLTAVNAALVGVNLWQRPSQACAHATPAMPATTTLRVEWPQLEREFAEAGNNASESALSSDLQTVRSQIELYKIQHLDGCPVAATFRQQLTSRTNAAGTVMPADADLADYPFGPYLQQFPSNPFVTGETTNQVQAEAGTDSLGGGSHGWHFDTDTGQFRADDDGHTGL